MPSSKYKPTDPDLIKLIHELQARVAKLERTPQTANAGVDSTGVIVRSGFVRHQLDDDFVHGYHSVGANTAVNNSVGISAVAARDSEVNTDYFTSDGTNEVGALSYRIVNVEGSTFDPANRFPTVTIYDKSGDPILSDSANARRGLGDPILGIPWNDKVLSATTSGTFVDVGQFEWFQYHAHCALRLISSNDASTTGTVIALEESTGNTVASITTPAGTTQYNDLIIKRSVLENGAQPNGASTIISIQHERASGAGTVRTRIVSIVGADYSAFLDF